VSKHIKDDGEGSRWKHFLLPGTPEDGLISRKYIKHVIFMKLIPCVLNFLSLIELHNLNNDHATFF
jgi:hypothetical protein